MTNLRKHKCNISANKLHITTAFTSVDRGSSHLEFWEADVPLSEFWLRGEFQLKFLTGKTEYLTSEYKWNTTHVPVSDQTPLLMWWWITWISGPPAKQGRVSLVPVFNDCPMNRWMFRPTGSSHQRESVVPHREVQVHINRQTMRSKAYKASTIWITVGISQRKIIR